MQPQIPTSALPPRSENSLLNAGLPYTELPKTAFYPLSNLVSRMRLPETAPSNVMLA